MRVVQDIVRLAKDTSKKCVLYEIYEAGRDAPIYTGVTEQAPKGDKSAAEVRFGQHWNQVQNILKTDDYCHLYMTGRLSEHCSLNGIRKTDVTADVFREVFSVREVKEIRVPKKKILDEETKHIEVLKANNPGALLLNTQKNSSLVKKAKSTLPDQTESSSVETSCGLSSLSVNLAAKQHRRPQPTSTSTRKPVSSNDTKKTLV